MASTTFRWQGIYLALRLFIGLILITSCQTQALTTPSPSTASPQVEITVLAAQLIGKLDIVDGCLRVTPSIGTSYTLAWTPDLKATVEADHVRVEIGVMRTKQREVILYFGKTVSLMGGATPLDEQTQKSLPEHCQGPYWVVGDIR